MCLGLVGGAAFAQGDALKLAEEAYQQGHYPQARELGRQAVAKEPVKAWRIVGASSCAMKDRAGALEALGHLPAKADAELIRFACQRAGVEISDEDALVWQSPARAEVERA